MWPEGPGRSKKRALALALLAAIACGPDAGKSPADEDEKTREIMREIFAGIRVALPASVDRERFSAPANRPEIAAALDVLDRNAGLLARHARGRDIQMQYLARSVSHDSSEIMLSYADGRYDRAAYLLRNIVENCVVCHTRLRSEDSPVAEGFVDAGVMERLPDGPRATLLLATRRFDEGLGTLERLLADPLTHPAVTLGPLTDYLVVSIRVKGDFQRPVPVLEAFSQRKDLWPDLRNVVQGWIRSLPALEERVFADDATVAEARALIDEGEQFGPASDTKAGLLHFVAASAVLERVIDSRPERPAELGEAYYLLGLVESRIGRNYWVTPAPFLLEEAIRAAPAEPYARDAYAVLERELNAAYEGSDVEELPAVEVQRLAELRALIESS